MSQTTHRVYKYNHWQTMIPPYHFAPYDEKVTEFFFPKAEHDARRASFIISFAPKRPYTDKDKDYTFIMYAAEEPRLADEVLWEKIPRQAEKLGWIELDDALYHKTVDLWEHQQMVEKLTAELNKDFVGII